MVKSTRSLRSRRPAKTPAAKSAARSAAGKLAPKGRKSPAPSRKAARKSKPVKAPAKPVKAAATPVTAAAKSKAAAAPPKPKAVAAAPKSGNKRRANGSTPSATARRKARRGCAISSAARARTSPRWPISACRCRPASPSPPRSAPTSIGHGKTYPKELEAQVEAGARRGRPDRRPAVRRPRQPAARLGALRRPRLDAGHDGHRAQPRPQRRDRRGAGQRAPATGASPMIRYRRFITMYSNVVLGLDHHLFEEILDEHKDQHGYMLDTELDADDWAELVKLYKAKVEEEHGAPFPQDPHDQLWGAIGAVFGSLDEPARHHLSPPPRHSRELGHRRQRPGDGVRQHGRDLGDRRRLHPQSLDRREAALRRVPDQRPGRGRRRRHPHAAGDHRDRAPGVGLRQAVAGGARCRRRSPSSPASTGCWRRITATCRTSSSRSSRASCGCCRPAPASAPPRRRCASRSSSRTKA